MKKIALTFSIYFCFYLLFISCQKDDNKDDVFKIDSVLDSEINIDEIEEAVGCSFDILRTETLGLTTKHKFLWICLDLELDLVLLEKLAYIIIQDIIVLSSDTYYSFTIHFFYKGDLYRTTEDSYSFAKAEYLPKGGWTQVGREPINEYKNYQLTITSHNQ